MRQFRYTIAIRLPGIRNRPGKRGFQGTVILKVLVDKDGRVADIRLQESSGHSILDNIALETVRGWAFTPGRRGEDPVEMWIRVPMLFELK